MPNFLKNIFKFANLKSSAPYSVEHSFLDKTGLEILINKITSDLNKIYPIGIVIEMKGDIDPNVSIGGDWWDITSKYVNLPENIKKWQRIIKSNANKTTLQKSYDQYKVLKQEDYTEASWLQFAEALEKARTILEDPSATQQEVDKMNTDLTVAFISLRKKPN